MFLIIGLGCIACGYGTLAACYAYMQYAYLFIEKPMKRTPSTPFPSRFKAHETIRPKDLEEGVLEKLEPVYLEPGDPKIVISQPMAFEKTAVLNTYTTATKPPMEVPPAPPLPKRNSNESMHAIYENSSAQKIKLLKTY